MSKRIIIATDGILKLFLNFMMANIADLNQASQKTAPHMSLHWLHIIQYLRVGKRIITRALSINKRD